ncbi:flagellin [Bacillaceae bacterium S4-13-58]
MISLIQTAEGALNETHSILQRMRELAVQSANDSNTSSDREELQKEVNQLRDEIGRIASATEFNTKKLLNGNAGVTATYGETGVTLVEGNDTVAAGQTLQLDSVIKATAATVTISGGAVDEDISIGSNGANLKINGVQVNLAAGTTGSDIADALNELSDRTGVTATYAAATSGAAGQLVLTSSNVGSDAKIELSGISQTTTTGAATDTFVDESPTAAGVSVQFGSATPTTSLTSNSYNTSYGVDASASVDAAATDGVDPVTISGKGNVLTMHGGTWDGVQVKLESDFVNASDVDLTIQSNNSLKFQIGANEGQSIGLSINNMDASALGVAALDLTTQSGADAAITDIQSAIDKVSAERSKLGAYQNRLDHTINNLGTSSENLTAAESRIRDVDMAKEMMAFTKNNILSQAAQSMLAQLSNLLKRSTNFLSKLETGRLTW